ncbi:hypothetical protein QBC45DRAFT_388229, partial [Copromyces sp. CBS 386.78]
FNKVTKLKGRPRYNAPFAPEPRTPRLTTPVNIQAPPPSTAPAQLQAASQPASRPRGRPRLQPSRGRQPRAGRNPIASTRVAPSIQRNVSAWEGVDLEQADEADRRGPAGT